MKQLSKRKPRIFEDINGHICLDDLWRAAKAKETRSPAKWRKGRMAQALIVELEKKIKISSLKENKPFVPSVYARRGRGIAGRRLAGAPGPCGATAEAFQTANAA